MVILEALNALAGDCLVLRYPGPDNKERLWIIDGGPKTDRKKEILSSVPLGRYASVDEIAGVVTWLASDAAAYLTGAVIPVDGGLGMGH